jgi:hypothetical protein
MRSFSRKQSDAVIIRIGTAGGSAEESVRGCGALCAESVGALTRFLEDREMEINKGATERANRDIALNRPVRSWRGKG